MNRKLALALKLLFFVSGATGLVYEIIWMRQLILVFGSTTYAVSSVLSAFMLGLALGSFSFGRAADRGTDLVRLYGCLEIGVGLYALLAPALLQGAAPRVAHALGLDPENDPVSIALRFVLSLFVLLPPTILMGGTLPVLSRLFTRPGGDPSSPVGRLYALNTFGAVSGTFLAGFVLLPVLGTRRATLLTASINIALGLAAVLLSRLQLARGAVMDARTSAAASADEVTSAPSAAIAAGGGAAAAGAPARSRLSGVLLVFALSGFVAMIYEVAWSRVISLTIGSSVYGFTMMLIAFLIGLSAGAALFARLASRASIDPGRLLAAVLAATGLAAWGTSLLFGALPFWFWRLYHVTGGAAWPMLAGEFALCLLVMLPATIFMGGVFPLVLRVHASGARSVASRVGEAYAANTAGTVIGSAVAGFLLVPHLGIRTTLILASSLSLVLAACVIWRSLPRPSGRLLALGAAAACAVFLLVTPPWDPLMMNSGVYYDPEVVGGESTRAGFQSFLSERDKVLFYREGPTASVLVGQDTEENNLYVKVNGKTDASTGFDMPTQVFLGQIPLLLHPNPKKVLVIGLGSGVSVGAVATHPVESIRVVEVEPAMVEAAKYFNAYNREVLSDPRVSIHIGDARNTLLLHDESYDVIVSEPSNPWMTVASNLFTRDFFALAKTRLEHDGIFCQWFQVYSMTPENLRTLLATFRSVFPHALVFWVGESTDLVVVGSEEPIPLDYGEIGRRASNLPVAVDLARVGLYKIEDFLPFLYLDSRGLESYVAGSSLNTDDNARIEFSAPLSLYSDKIVEIEREIARHRVRLQDVLSGIPEAPAARQDFFLDLAQALVALHRPKAALEALGSAESIGPSERSAHIRDEILSQKKKS